MEEIIEYYEHGSVKAKGFLNENRKEGEWMHFFKSGKSFMQEFYKNDMLDGPSE